MINGLKPTWSPESTVESIALSRSTDLAIRAIKIPPFEEFAVQNVVVYDCDLFPANKVVKDIMRKTDVTSQLRIVNMWSINKYNATVKWIM
jgi:hypothetical protein